MNKKESKVVNDKDNEVVDMDEETSKDLEETTEKVTEKQDVIKNEPELESDHLDTEGGVKY